MSLCKSRHWGWKISSQRPLRGCCPNPNPAKPCSTPAIKCRKLECPKATHRAGSRGRNHPTSANPLNPRPSRRVVRPMCLRDGSSAKINPPPANVDSHSSRSRQTDNPRLHAARENQNSQNHFHHRRKTPPPHWSKSASVPASEWCRQCLSS